ncbi:MAG: nucleotidyltransferase family protein [Bryobacteraceae bacterium]|nr:nucleotidyltransferase family protein [Bryobacteraceae bacterium]
MREAVFRFVAGGGGASGAAAAEIAASRLWTDAASLANRWSVLPPFNRRLAACGVEVPESFWPVFRTLATNAFVRSALQARKGIDVLRAFQQRGIPAAGFKGLASMALLWGGPEQRTIQDVDVLVAERDLDGSLALLASLGFRPLVGGEFADYEAFVRRSPGFSGNAEITLYDGERCGIDLHWRLGAGLSVEGILARSSQVELLGAPVRVVALEDGLALCVHHMLRNGFSPDKGLRDLLDAEEWIELALRREALDRTLELTAGSGLSGPLLATTVVLAGLNPGSPAAVMNSRLATSITPSERAAAGRLASLFLLQVREGSLNSDLLYLLRPNDLKRIASAFFSGWRRHREIMQSAEIELEGATRPLPSRLAALLCSVARVRRRHLRMLRALARAKDAAA